MTELELYRFVNDNNIEYHWYDGDVIMFVNNYLLDEFHLLLGDHIFDEEGIECVFKGKYCCFYLKDICESFDIELENIFDKSF